MFYDPPVLIVVEEEEAAAMEGENGEKNGSFRRNGDKIQTFGDVIDGKRGESSSSFEFLTSEAAGHGGHSHSCSEEETSSPLIQFIWPEETKDNVPDCTSTNDPAEDVEKPHLDNRRLEKQGSSISDGVEIEMMKERFAKLLLGEDMSGSGNGVCTALAISNAITNLCATLFGQLWRLEPLPPEKRAMWKREMEWLLCVSDHIVELNPSWQTFPDGSKIEVMTCRPRSDLYVNLPALRKLDNMLMEVLDSFDNTEFWYVEQGILAPEADGSTSFQHALERQEDKWWLPVSRVPPGGLHAETRKELKHKRDCTKQILKAAMAINSCTLADMEVPESYLESLPKNGRASLGDLIYRYVSSDRFTPEYLLDCLDLTSEHLAIELANRVEAAIYVWRKRSNSKPVHNASQPSSKSSWGLVKELVVDADKRDILADRAESLLLCLKQRFPGLPQTSLDISKIQCNKDVGKSILESYSRVLESLAFNVIARINDLLYVDDLTKRSDQFPTSISKVSVVSHKVVPTPYTKVPVSSTPYKTASATPNFSPLGLVSPIKGDRSATPNFSPLGLVSPVKGDRSATPNFSPLRLVSPIKGDRSSGAKIPQNGVGFKKVLTDFLTADSGANKDYCDVKNSSPGKNLAVDQKQVHNV